MVRKDNDQLNTPTRAGKSNQMLQHVPTDTLDFIEQQGFQDSFTQAHTKTFNRATASKATAQRDADAHAQHAKLSNPTYTVWTGTVVDFIFCSPEWNLPVESYIYYSTASDHLPVIMDIILT